MIVLQSNSEAGKWDVSVKVGSHDSTVEFPLRDLSMVLNGLEIEVKSKTQSKLSQPSQS